MVILLFRPIK